MANWPVRTGRHGEIIAYYRGRDEPVWNVPLWQLCEVVNAKGDLSNLSIPFVTLEQRTWLPPNELRAEPCWYVTPADARLIKKHLKQQKAALPPERPARHGA